MNLEQIYRLKQSIDARIEKIKLHAEVHNRPLTAEEEDEIVALTKDGYDLDAMAADKIPSAGRRADPQEPGLGPGAYPEPYTGPFAIAIEGQKIPALTNKQKLARYFRPKREDAEWSISDFIRLRMGKQPKNQLVSGEGLVPSFLSARIIDDVRAKTTLIKAGAVTIPISGPTTLCKITGDPTFYVHTEAQADISETVPTYAPVTLNPKALVAAVGITEELLEDAPNLDAVLRMSLSGAFAKALDAEGLKTILADTNIPAGPEETDSWMGLMAAVTAMLEDDQEVPRACIASPADFAERAQAAAEESGLWLGPPPLLKDMLDLETSLMDDGKAVLGGFTEGLALATRKDLTLELVRFKEHRKFSHVLMAYARMGFYVLQPKRLYIAGGQTT